MLFPFSSSIATQAASSQNVSEVDVDLECVSETMDGLVERDKTTSSCSDDIRLSSTETQSGLSSTLQPSSEGTNGQQSQRGEDRTSSNGSGSVSEHSKQTVSKDSMSHSRDTGRKSKTDSSSSTAEGGVSEGGSTEESDAGCESGTDQATGIAGERPEPDKYLIFTTGSLTYTPHQIGIKRIRHDNAIGKMQKLAQER